MEFVLTSGSWMIYYAMADPEGLLFCYGSGKQVDFDQSKLAPSYTMAS
jgi:hypothetical protein